MKQTATILFLHTSDELLLAMKKRGFGKGLWNGVGGKPEPGETIEQTAIRECKEEIVVEPVGIQRVAELQFLFTESGEGDISEMNATVFMAREWSGVPRETEEMSPRWFSKNNIPYDDMWSDDIYWLPEVLSGHFVHGTFFFDEKDKVIQHKIETQMLDIAA